MYKIFLKKKITSVTFQQASLLLFLFYTVIYFLSDESLNALTVTILNSLRQHISGGRGNLL